MLHIGHFCSSFRSPFWVIGSGKVFLIFKCKLRNPYMYVSISNSNLYFTVITCTTLPVTIQVLQEIKLWVLHVYFVLCSNLVLSTEVDIWYNFWKIHVEYSWANAKIRIKDSKQVPCRWSKDIRKLAPENGSIYVLDMKNNFHFVVYRIRI